MPLEASTGAGAERRGDILKKTLEPVSWFVIRFTWAKKNTVRYF